MQKTMFLALILFSLVIAGCSEPDLNYECASDEDCAAGLVCADRLCLVKNDCPEGQTKCGDLCVNISSDINHCGSCEPCPELDNANATSCVLGQCTYSCDGGWTDQDDDLRDGIAGTGCECPPNTSCACDTDCSAPEPSCDGNAVVDHNGPGIVQDNCTCDFSTVQTRTECATGEICSAGACVAVECTQDEDCERPAPSCDSEGLVVRWVGEGTCQNNNTCDFEDIHQECLDQEVCNDGACVEVECTNDEHCPIPAASCDDNTAITYSTEETLANCQDDNTCDFASIEVRTDCSAEQQVCNNGACENLCEGVECPLPESYCDGMFAVHSVAGSCDWETGQCMFEREREGCASSCSGGLCIPSGFVLVPAGSFTNSDGLEFTLTHNIAMEQHEVTRSKYRELIEDDPSQEIYPSLDIPVHNLSWMEAAVYANSRSRREALPVCYDPSGESVYESIYDCPGYRLPTEAEWEHAYRAGTTTDYHCGEDYNCIRDYAWCDNAHSGSPGYQLVGTKMPNPWGLYDMAGGATEWCHDWAPPAIEAGGTDVVGASDKKITRGTAWNNSCLQSTAGFRGVRFLPGTRNLDAGVRLVRTLR